jgi:hypothetical protein
MFDKVNLSFRYILDILSCHHESVVNISSVGELRLNQLSELHVRQCILLWSRAKTKEIMF